MRFRPARTVRPLLTPLLVAAAVVLVAVALVLPSAVGPPHRSPNPPGIAPPPVVVTLGSWTSENVTAHATCAACSTAWPAGSIINVTLDVQPDCGTYGCSGTLEAASLSAAFDLLGIAPDLPAPLARGGSEFRLNLQLPVGGGAHTLSGTLSATGLPGPVEIASQSFILLNATNGTDDMFVDPPPAPLYLPPGSFYNETLTVDNPTLVFDRVDSITVAPPFLVVGTEPGFPYTVNPNDTGEVVVELQMPAQAGTYALNGTIWVDLLPVIIIAALNISFSNGPTPFVASNIAFDPQILTGGVYNGSLEFTNTGAATHTLAFNHTTGEWFFGNSTPVNETMTLGPGQTLRFYLTLIPWGPAGEYDFGLVFRQVS